MLLLKGRQCSYISINKKEHYCSLSKMTAYKMWALFLDGLCTMNANFLKGDLSIILSLNIFMDPKKYIEYKTVESEYECFTIQYTFQWNVKVGVVWHS